MRREATVAGEGRKVRTIEVAAQAGISQSTVSRALAGDPRISQATKDRVLEAAERLGYRPNLIARGLKNRTTGIVGVVVTDLDSPYHAHALRLLIDEMGVQGLAPLVFSCNAAERAGAVIGRLAGYQVDAVIALAAPFDTEIVKSCRGMGRPLVLMNDHEGEAALGIVAGDGHRGGALIAAHLVECGARSFGFFAGEDSTRISQEREDGFRAGLRALGFACTRRAAASYDYAAAAAAAEALLQDPPDAVFCANDTLAQALVDTARLRFGMRMPQDLLVAGYDNSALASRPVYGLTSVDQGLEEMAARAVAMVIQMLAAPQAPPPRVVVPPRLVIRNSTRASD